MWGDLVPWPGIQPRPPALGLWSLSHRPSGKVSMLLNLATLFLTFYTPIQNQILLWGFWLPLRMIFRSSKNKLINKIKQNSCLFRTTEKILATWEMRICSSLMGTSCCLQRVKDQCSRLSPSSAPLLLSDVILLITCKPTPSIEHCLVYRSRQVDVVKLIYKGRRRGCSYPHGVYNPVWKKNRREFSKQKQESGLTN